MKLSLCASALAATVNAVALPVVSQIADGQIQEPTGSPVMQIPDGQVQVPKGSPAIQIPDGQVQVPTGAPVNEVPDGQIQAPAGAMPSQYGPGPAMPPPTMSASAASQCSLVGSSSAKGPGASQPLKPFKFPLDNGFPNVSNATIKDIEVQAHGTLPNGPLPKKLSDQSATTLQLIAFNEIFEVAYFSDLLKNLTSGEYNIGAAQDFVVTAIHTIRAQEELHALGANAILMSAGRTPIQPCEYKYPASDFDTAIAVAELFTTLVLGVLAEAQYTFSMTGDGELISLFGAVLGQEGEQTGYYRATGKKVPSALPFLTGDTATFAFSALNQLFIVDGTCGNLEAINLPILKPLTVVSTPAPADMDITYSYAIDPSITDPSGLRLVLLNQQNVPIVHELQNIKVQDNTVTFTAPFPYTEFTMNGLTLAAVTNGKTSFASIAEVAAASVWGPGLINLN